MGFETAMMDVPRLALATAATGPEPSVMALALLAGLTEKRWRVQHFRTRACPAPTEVAGQVTGLPGRHLDSWLMPDSVCRSLFVRGMRAAELAVVEGTLDEPLEIASYCEGRLPGDLKPIANLLDLPVVAVVPVPESPGGDFHLPRLPDGTDAVLIDRIASADDLPRLRRLFRLAFKVPVLGALETLPAIRNELEQAPRNQILPEKAVMALGEHFLRHCDLDAIRDLARSRPFSDSVLDFCACGISECCRCFRVAYAQDDAFGRYFPDTFEALEALGAELVEFSPLRDEALPEGVDLVMIGCGIPDQYADRLASNLSMMAALREHVCRGQRIYSEGGGTAYLGHWMVIDGRPIRGVGILPFDAELLPDPRPPMPVARRLLHDSWLGAKGTVVRGYKSGRWRLHSSFERFECPTCFGSLSTEDDLFYHHHAVGSLIHLHLGALPEVVSAFAGPHRPSLKRPSVQGLADQA
jgi:cobyrinic acid a,c-diamide synthase